MKALPDETTKKGRASKGKALATMKDLEKLYAVDAEEAAAAAPTAEGPPRISCKDSMFLVGEEQLPDPLELIVVADAHLNVWYEDEYDPATPSPPSCFALAPAKQKDAPAGTTGEEALHAHPTSPNRQGGPNDHDCASCPKNAFGSAEKGRGKACGNTRQLAVVRADDPSLFNGGDVRWAIMGLSATALSPWGKFVNGLSKIEHRPPHGAVIKFSFNKKDPDERRRKAVIAIGYQLIDDPRVASKVLGIRKEILESKVLLRPLPVEVRKPGKPEKKSKPKAKAERARAARF